MIYQRPDELYHYGVKGMRWGVRRYQNEDGSLKAAGERHRAQRENGSYSGSSKRSSGGSSKSADRKRKLKKALGLTLGAAAAAGLAYGGYKLHKNGGGAYLRSKYYGAKAKYHGAKAKFHEDGGASGLVNRIGGRAKNKANQVALRGQILADKGRSAVARGKQKYYESGGSVANMARRKWTSSGGARGIASGVTGRAKSAAKYYGNKASDFARSTRTNASVAGIKAKSALRSAKNNALTKYYDTKTNYYNAGGASGIARSVGSKAKNTGLRVASRAASGLGRGIERTGRAAVSTGSRLRSEVAARGGVSGIARSAYDRRKRRRQANRATLSRF